MSNLVEKGPKRPGRSFVVALAALAVTAGAGVAIWSSIGAGALSEFWPTAQPIASGPGPAKAPVTPGAGAPGRPIGDDERAFWSEVAVYKSGPGRPRSVVAVKRGKQPASSEKDGLYQGLLAREVVRQGLLLAAREEFGAVTRDVPIGDVEPSGAPDATFRIGSRFRVLAGSGPDDPNVGRVTIVSGEGADRRVLWSREFDCEMIIAPNYGRLVSIVEGFSRQGFRTVLGGRGLARSGPSPLASKDEGGGLPESVDRGLGLPVETEQFAAIRALHEAIRTRGETPSRLVALAKAYANLGKLSECQWTADYLAFQARALLYAERAAVREHESPETLRGRAHVRALAGLFREAILDVEKSGGPGGGKDQPYEVEMVRAYAASDAAALERTAGEHPGDPWPRLLRFLTVSESSGYYYTTDKNCRHDVLAASRPILESVPDCYRVYDGLIQMSGVANLHTATSVGYGLYAQAMPERVAALPGLPKAVSGLRPEGGEPAEVGLRRAIDAAAADDPAEPTWGVLARQLREIRFFLAGRRVEFIAYSLAAPTGDVAAEALPLLADHPNRAYIESFLSRFDGPDLAGKLKGLDLADIEPKAGRIAQRFNAFDPAEQSRLSGLAWTHIVSGTVPGQIAHVATAADESRGQAAHNLLKYHPGSPLGRAALIASRWDEAKPNAEAWAKDHGGADTLVVAELGLRSLNEERLDEAERLLREALDRSPEGWLFEGLAGVYVRRGDVDGYAKAAAEYLQTDDLNLDHAKVAGNLAEFLMKLGEYAKARPFAEYSAQSWAGWAMMRASRCAEGMGDWEGAEQWIARTSERYDSSWLQWYAWCQRTGRGNPDAAGRLIEQQLNAGRSLRSHEEQIQVATALIGAGASKSARRVLEPAYEEKHDTTLGLLLAVACDLDGDPKARDAAMKAVGDDSKPSAPLTAKVVAALGDWLAKGGKNEPDLARVDGLVEQMKPEARPNCTTFVGLLLDRHGQADAAIKYLKQADTDKTYLWFRYLARSVLRARGTALEPIPAS